MEYHITAISKGAHNTISFVYYSHDSEEEIVAHVERFGYEIVELEMRETRTSQASPDVGDDEFLRVLREGGILDMFK